MKKTHWALAIGGSLCAFGLLLGAAALALNGFDFMRTVTTVKYEQKTAAYEPALLEGIDVAAEDMKIVVSPSPDGQVHLTYWESAADIVTVGVNNGRLEFRHNTEESWIDNFIHGFWNGLSRLRHYIEVKIPSDYTGSLLVSNDNAALSASGLSALSGASFYAKNASLELTDITSPGALTAETTNGSLSLDRVSAGSARITNTNARIRLIDTHLGDTVLQTDNGSVLLSSVSVGSLTAKTKNASFDAESLTGTGRVELETTNGSLSAIDVKTAGDLSLKSKNGNVRATNCSSAALTAGTSNGKIDLSRCKAERIQAETSNSAHEFDRLESLDITLSSSNGGIRGSVLGREEDYVIVTRTTNGSSNITDRVGDLPGRLNISTTNASIRVTFES